MNIQELIDHLKGEQEIHQYGDYDEHEQVINILEKTKALVEKLEVVHESDAYKGVWTLHYIHGGLYQGPTYEKELKELKELL